MKTLTRSNENHITEDWRRQLPSLGIYKPRHLLRRVGPLLVGVCLDRDSGGDIYIPTLHVHCLCKEFPCVSLTLSEQLRAEKSRGPDYIEVRWHADKHVEAAARMARQATLSLAGDLSLSDVVAAYRGYMTHPPGIYQCAVLYQDMILIAAWVGDTHMAGVLLAEVKSSLSDDDAAYRHVGGRAAFESRCETAIADRTVVDALVVSQISELGVAELPVSELTQ